MTDHPNITAALAAFQAEMPAVPKTKRANIGKYSYTYADLADVTEAAMPLLAKHGLAFTTTPRYTAHGYELRGTLLHTSGGRVRGSLPIKGNAPQEFGSSLTYMRRYLLGCLTGVVTEEDTDGSAAAKAPPKPEDQPQSQRMSRQQPAGQIHPQQLTLLHTLFNKAGIIEKGYRIDYCRNLIGRDIESSKDLTAAEASRVIDLLKSDTDE